MIKKLILLLIFLIPINATAGDVKETILPNGLKVLTLENHKAPVVTFQVWYKVGSRNDPVGKTGISHLLEHMMFKGTKKYGPQEFSKIIQKNGGNDNAFTSKDYSTYFQNISSDRIDILLELESDRMVNLLIYHREVLSERDVVAEERRMRYEDDPQSTIYEELMATAFKAHPYRWPVIGWMADIQSINRDDLYNHYRTYYVPNNATIVVVGDFDTDKLLKKIESSFGTIPKGLQPPEYNFIEPPQKGERRVVVKKEAQLPYIAIAYHVPNFKESDSYPLEVLSVILSGGKSSRLYENIVYKKQIALYAGGEYEGLSKDPSLFYLYASVAPGKKVEEVESSLYEEIERLKNELVTDREIEKAKNQLNASFIMGQDSNFYQGMLLGRYEVMSDWRLKDQYLEGIRKVTKEDIQRVAKKYLIDDNRTVGILIPLLPKGS
jgi:zinc protease